MLYTQWNYDDAVSVEREEAYEDGREAGKAEDIALIICDFLNRLGKIPEDIRKSIEDEQDGEILKKWCMAAPGVKSFEEFRESMHTTDK